MGYVIANMSMSLDGFIEDADGSPLRLFEWMGNGDQRDAAYFQEATAGVGALVCGRRLYDVAQAWGGRHPIGTHVFVVTHTPPADLPDADAFTFVTDGVASAIAQAQQLAGERTVAVATADITRQCLDLGPLDGIAVDLVSILLGSGTPFFSGLAGAPVDLDTPSVTEGTGVTHLHYAVRKTAAQ